MTKKVYIGKFPTGASQFFLPFNIDNAAFPNLYNFYVRRGRLRRKRGTLSLNRLQIQVSSAAAPAIWQVPAFTFYSAFVPIFDQLGVNPAQFIINDISNAAQAVVNITGQTFTMGQVVFITGVLGMNEINGGYYTIVGTGVNTITLNVNSLGFGVATPGTGVCVLTGTASIVPNTCIFIVGADTYTEPVPADGTLLKNGVLSGGNFIWYSAGLVQIISGGAGMTGSFHYYPGLPTMALEDFVVTNTVSQNNELYPTLLAFDTKYSYQINNGTFYNTTFYTKNVPFTWTGQDFQKFWTTNYSGALWATNNKPGMHVLAGSVSGMPSSTDINFTFTLNGTAWSTLTVGDILWFNEWNSAGTTLNGITGVITVNFGAGVYTVHFTTSQTVSGTGIVQVLTNSIPIKGNYPVTSIPQDGIRYYLGDPTSTTGLPTGNLGWVNFAPPLTATEVSINGRIAAQYYLVGALAILPYKDYLLFFSPFIQTSSGSPILLQDTVIFSQNGTPFYFVQDGNNTSTTNAVPANESALPMAYYVDESAFGGWVSAGIAQPIATVNNNQDVLLVGFGGDGRKTRLVFTGSNLQPFLFFNINSELPSQATFSAVALDRGVIDIGQYGIAMTDQQSSQRVDLDMPDQVFRIQALNNGVQRVNAIRDFFNEWIYFSYPVNTSQWYFPTQTFLYNYRENTWAIFYENWTAHGNYRPTSKKSWLTLPFKTWNQWREPWNSGVGSPQIANIICGNPQGYVLIRSQGTGEGTSGVVSAIQPNGEFTQITSYNHCVTAQNPVNQEGDYLFFSGLTGLLTSTITGITLGPTTTITTVNTFNVNALITINGVVGTTQLNGNTYQIIASSGASITINVDSTNFTAWSSGGTVQATFNNYIGQVISTIDANNFVVDIPYPQNSYAGLGTFARLSVPLFQTKQFNFYWEQGLQTRIGPQKYLMDKTNNSQVTVNIYLSQDPNDAWNSPQSNPAPNGLVYSQIMYTCPESTNLGLTPANTNLQMPTAIDQFQIWHRFNTSMIGDTIQIGMTLSDAQMRNYVYATDEITVNAMQLDFDPGPHLA